MSERLQRRRRGAPPGTDRGPNQTEARALGDPTRHRIFRHVADADRPVGVAELTQLLGLNHNAVRQHLGVLKEAQLVLEEPEERGKPGRPRLLYRLNPEVRGRWGTDGPYELLAALLAEAIRGRLEPREVGRRAGRRRARDMTHRGGTLAAIEQDLLAGGFRPQPAARTSGGDFVLQRCPFAQVAADDPATVCQLHLGMAEGLAEEIGEGAVVELVAKDPCYAGCRLEVHIPSTAQASA